MQSRAAEPAFPPPDRQRRWRVSARGVAFGIVLLAYIVVTIGVLVTPSPLLDLDTYLVNLHLWHHYPQYYPFINNYVIFGQRGPATLAFLPFFLFAAWRRRSTEPLVVLGTALVLLNLSVGVVKYSIGRVGPLHNGDVHLLFAGGTIYPSGHVSNTVVLYGALAWAIPRFRRTLIALAVFLSVSVGLGTIYLRTHWFSDVVGGWIAGSLVLLALPTFLPMTQRWTDQAIAALRARRLRRRATAAAPPPAPATYRPPVAPGRPARPARPAHARRKATSVS